MDWGWVASDSSPADEIKAIIRKAIDHGINFFDRCTASATYVPFGVKQESRMEEIDRYFHT